jgi:hypothetical protein
MVLSDAVRACIKGDNARYNRTLGILRGAAGGWAAGRTPDTLFVGSAFTLAASTGTAEVVAMLLAAATSNDYVHCSGQCTTIAIRAD